jgi:hypothetical protein
MQPPSAHNRPNSPPTESSTGRHRGVIGTAPGWVDSLPFRLRPRLRIVIVPKPFPAELCRDVISVARKGEASVAQVVWDFGISKFCCCAG